MELDSWIALIVAILCLLLIAVSSAVQTAINNVSGLRLRQLMEGGVPRAQAIQDLINHPDRFPATLVLVNTITLLTIGSLALYASNYFEAWWEHVLAVVVAALVVLIFGVAVPKALAIRNPERTALVLYGPIDIIQRIVSPLVGLTTLIAAPFVRLFGGRSAPVGTFVTQEEMRMMMNVGEKEGVIPMEEEQLIHSIFEFGDTVVREVMVPRTYMDAVGDTETINDAADKVLHSGHTRLPIYKETVDTILGVATGLDLIKMLRQGKGSASVVEIIRPVFYVPETKKVDELLRDLQKGRMHMAIVVDEYGGTAGLVTIEDLIEEIVGEIQDEYDVEPQMMEQVSDNEIKVDARVPLDDINDTLGTHWEAEDSDTVGGFVYERLGRIPEPGDKVEMGQYVITVLSTEGARLKQLSIVRNQPAEDDEDTGYD